MQQLPDRIRTARERSGKTPAEVSEAIGITVSALSQWETGATKPGLVNLIKFAEATSASLDYILRALENDSALRAFNRRVHAPLLSRVQAGKWGNVVTPFSLPTDVQYVELFQAPRGTAIALELDGESMAPEYMPGDIIVIDTGLEPAPGDLVVAVLENEEEATFKRFRPRGFGPDNQPVIELAPLNLDFPTLVMSGANSGRIIGTLMQHIRFPKKRSSRA